MKRAFAYLRVSTGSQELSPLVQRDQIAAYCVVKGYMLVDVLEETGVSGTVPFARREQGGALLARLADVDAVVFSKLDRAFRDTVDCIMTVEQLRAAGKAVHFLDLGIDTTTAAGQLCMEMMASFAKFERRRIADRTKEALGAARIAGKKLGGVPFGFRPAARIVDGRKVDGGVHVPVASEQSVIEQVRALRFDARGRKRPFRAIAAELNRMGVPSPRGGRWHGEQARRVVARGTS
jgi:DNA invertase Pin-like site-specific DNA recombinase